MKLDRSDLIQDVLRHQIATQDTTAKGCKRHALLAKRSIFLGQILGRSAPLRQITPAGLMAQSKAASFVRHRAEK
ncbi:hypothetical protein A3732_12950 [Oleiphilus sp. HI0050]|nr:hypothetical protein A3732_12950 [Oleiphilus sp. HI0050]